MRGDWYQVVVIVLGVVITVLFGAFLYREIFPEYKIYQNRYIELEKIRSTYTGEPPPTFERGIKQILIEKEGGAPPVVDRCTSCHVALEFSHFSPTKIARDINGNIVLDDQGIPVKVPNENYVWDKLDNEELKSVEVGEHTYDLTKVLRMHPLIGRETRPFEYHPINRYGCTSCHSGNGRGLTTHRAHGPVFDGHYEEEFMGPKAQFLELDPKHDPKFARVFNAKPGHDLLFQTTPLFVGDLIQANCMQCHKSSEGSLFKAFSTTTVVATRRKEKAKAIRKAFEDEKQALISLMRLANDIEENGLTRTIEQVRQKATDYTLPSQQRKYASAQLEYLLRENSSQKINQEMVVALGFQTIVDQLKATGDLDRIIEENIEAPGSLFAKARAEKKEQEALFHVKETETAFEKKATSEQVITAMESEIDLMTKDYHRGKELYISQACYACHRINGLTRGGVGPELTQAGKSYPWFIKESIVWPQADLKTSTMPNYKLDHEELEDLMTFLLAQHGKTKVVSETDYRIALMEWEAGRKLPWEKPINPAKLQDLRYSMTVFTTEGCAACHRLKGFESNVGYDVEKQNPDFETLYQKKEWFKNLIPESIVGSELVKAIDRHTEEIDQRIVDDVRHNSILEEIEQNHPELIESFYSNFKYAFRAKDSVDWKERVRRVMMMYVQEYGLGRLIGPRPNWTTSSYHSSERLFAYLS